MKLKINKTIIDEQTFIQVVEDFLNAIIITDFDSQSYVAKILLKDKLNNFKTSANKNKIANDINDIMFESFNVSFK